MSFIGNKLSQEEIEEMYNALRSDNNFNTLLEEINKHKEFTPDSNYDVRLALKFDTQYENHYFSSKAVQLGFSDDILLAYHITNSDQGEQIEIYGATDSLLIRVKNGETEVIESEETDQQITTTSNPDPYEGYYMTDDYYPGIIKETVQSDSWYGGCIPGGYIWCGESCGGAAACNSPLAGINPLDRCCKTHDCCYASRGVRYPDFACDCVLCACAYNRRGISQEPVAAALVIAVMCTGCAVGS